MKQLWRVWALLWVLGSTTSAVTGAVFSSQQAEDVVRFVETFRRCKGVVGVTAAVVRGDDTWTRGFGLSDRERGRDVSTSHLFGIGSVTKSFTAALLSRLIDMSRGRYSWNTTVAEILGQDFQFVNEELTRQVTLEDILTHRTGLDNDVLVMVSHQYQHMNTRDKFLRVIRHLGVEAPFREKFIYNNWMYALAGKVAEQMAGGRRSWDSLVTTYLLEPLGMRQTRPDVREVMVQQTDTMAKPYALFGGKLIPTDPLIYNLGPFGPAGSLASSAEDMARWMRLFLNKGRVGGRQLFTEDQITQMTSPIMDLGMNRSYVSRPTFPVDFTRTSYGMGWNRGTYRGHKVIWHAGQMWGYRTFLFLLPDLNVGIFLSTNGLGKRFKVAKRFRTGTFYHIADVILGEQPWLNLTNACQFPDLWEEGHNSSASATGNPPASDEYSDCTFHNRNSYVGDYGHPLFGTLSVRERGCRGMAVKYGLIEGRLCRKDTGTDNVLGFQVIGKMAFYFETDGVPDYVELSFTRLSGDKYQEVTLTGSYVPAAAFNRGL